MRSATDGAPSFVHVPELASAGDEITIGGPEGHYLRRVVRIRPGEFVSATDGHGTLAELHVLDTMDAVRAEVRSRRTVAREVTLALWCGAPEGDRADWLVEKLAELGAATLQPVDGERGRWERAERRAERWERLCIAALRQSRSAHRLVVRPPVALAELLAGPVPAGTRYLADPAGQPFAQPAPREPGGAVTAAIGPSGGFTEDELKRLRDIGFVPTRLTSSRLRTETAAVALAALVLSSGTDRIGRAGPASGTQP